jgi:hypothetical protein
LLYRDLSSRLVEIPPNEAIDVTDDPEKNFTGRAGLEPRDVINCWPPEKLLGCLNYRG